MPETLTPAETGNANIDGVVSAPIPTVMVGVAEIVEVIEDAETAPGVNVQVSLVCAVNDCVVLKACWVHVSLGVTAKVVGIEVEVELARAKAAVDTAVGVGTAVGTAVVGAAVGTAVVGTAVGMAVVGTAVGAAVVGAVVGMTVACCAVGTVVGAIAESDVVALWLAADNAHEKKIPMRNSNSLRIAAPSKLNIRTKIFSEFAVENLSGQAQTC